MLLLLASAVQAQAFKSCNSTRKDFWGARRPTDSSVKRPKPKKRPAPPTGPALPASPAEFEPNLAAIKLPRGFKISVFASGVNSARQMSWGDKGTLFVGSFGVGTAYVITDSGGKKEVKPTLAGLKMPTGIAFRNGAL